MTSTIPIGLWYEPADSSDLWDILKAEGYFNHTGTTAQPKGLYARRLSPAIEAAAKIGLRVTKLRERFPGSVFGRMNPDGTPRSANLWDFHDFESGQAASWAEMVHRVTMPNVADPSSALHYDAYLRFPSDLAFTKAGIPLSGADRSKAWQDVVRRLALSGATAAIELAADAFSLDCYDDLASRGKLNAIEPGREKYLPQLWRYPTVTLWRDLARADGVWPSNWAPISEWNLREIVLPDAPLEMDLVRFLVTTGWSVFIYEHRLREAAA